MVQINMLVLKHVKSEGRSTIDVVLDRELAAIDGIFSEDLERKFLKNTHEKNSFRLENSAMLLSNGDVMILELMKCLRRRQWLLMTSHSFVHFGLEKAMESHFYFERVLNPQASGGSLSPSLVSQTHSMQHQRQHQWSSVSEEYSQSSYTATATSSSVSRAVVEEESERRTLPAPEVTALLYEKAPAQSGPYGLARRHSLVSQQQGLRVNADGSQMSTGGTTYANNNSFNNISSPGANNNNNSASSFAGNKYVAVRAGNTASASVPAALASPSSAVQEKSSLFAHRSSAFEPKTPTNYSNNNNSNSSSSSSSSIATRSNALRFTPNAAANYTAAAAVHNNNNTNNNNEGGSNNNTYSAAPHIATNTGDVTQHAHTSANAYPPNAALSLRSPRGSFTEALSPAATVSAHTSAATTLHSEGSPDKASHNIATTQLTATQHTASHTASQHSTFSRATSPHTLTTQQVHTSSTTSTSTSTSTSFKVNKLPLSSPPPLVPSPPRHALTHTAESAAPPSAPSLSNESAASVSPTLSVGENAVKRKPLFEDESPAVPLSTVPVASVGSDKESEKAPVPTESATSQPAPKERVSEQMTNRYVASNPPAPARTSVSSAYIAATGSNSSSSNNNNNTSAPVNNNNNISNTTSVAVAGTATGASSSFGSAASTASAAGKLFSRFYATKKTASSNKLISPSSAATTASSGTNSFSNTSTPAANTTNTSTTPVSSAVKRNDSVDVSEPQSLTNSAGGASVANAANEQAESFFSPCKPAIELTTYGPTESSASEALPSSVPVPQSQTAHQTAMKSEAKTETERTRSSPSPASVSSSLSVPAPVPAPPAPVVPAPAAPSVPAPAPVSVSAPAPVVSVVNPLTAPITAPYTPLSVPATSSSSSISAQVAAPVPPAPVSAPAPAPAPAPVAAAAPIAYSHSMPVSAREHGDSSQHTVRSSSFTTAAAAPMPSHSQTPLKRDSFTKEKEHSSSLFSPSKITSFITGGSSVPKHDASHSSLPLQTPHASHSAQTTQTTQSTAVPPVVPEYAPPIVAKEGQDHFDMDYDLKSDIPRAVFKSDGKEVDEHHESSKLNHYSKLGSAFANNNALLRAGPAGGRGRGRGRGIQ